MNNNNNSNSNINSNGKSNGDGDGDGDGDDDDDDDNDNNDDDDNSKFHLRRVNLFSHAILNRALTWVGDYDISIYTDVTLTMIQ